jgi:hypothetical protein
MTFSLESERADNNDVRCKKRLECDARGPISVAHHSPGKISRKCISHLFTIPNNTHHCELWPSHIDAVTGQRHFSILSDVLSWECWPLVLRPLLSEMLSLSGVPLWSFQIKICRQLRSPANTQGWTYLHWKCSISSSIAFTGWHLEFSINLRNYRRALSLHCIEWHWASDRMTRLMKYFAVKCSCYRRTSTIENAYRVKKIGNIDLLDAMACLTFSGISLSNTSKDPIGKFCQRIHDSSNVQNPARFRCIAFWTEVASGSTGWMGCTLRSVVNEWRAYRQFQN